MKNKLKLWSLVNIFLKNTQILTQLIDSKMHDKGFFNVYTLVSVIFYISPLPPFYWGSPMLIDPHPTCSLTTVAGSNQVPKSLALKVLCQRSQILKAVVITTSKVVAKTFNCIGVDPARSSSSSTWLTGSHSSITTFSCCKKTVKPTSSSSSSSPSSSPSPFYTLHKFLRPPAQLHT